MAKVGADQNTNLALEKVFMTEKSIVSALEMEVGDVAIKCTNRGSI